MSFTNYDMWKIELKVKAAAREAARLDVAFGGVRDDVSEEASEIVTSYTSYAPAHTPLIADYKSAYQAGVKEFQEYQRQAAALVG